MGADSVLVNAALQLGMSRVPGDTAEIFNKQYEGLIAYSKATADAVTAGAKFAAEGARAIINVGRKKQGKELLGPLDFEGKEKEAFLTQKGKNKANEQDGKGEKKGGNGQETTKQSTTEEDNIKRGGELLNLERTTHGLYDTDKKKFTGTQKEINSLFPTKKQRNINKNTEMFGDKFMSGYELPTFTPDFRAPIKMKSPFKITEEQPVKTYNKPTTSQTKTTQSSVETTSTTPSLSEMNIAMERMATDVAVSSIKNNYSYYNKGGGLNEGHQDAAYAGLKGLKDQMYAIVSKKSQTTEDKQFATKLNQQAEKLKQGLVDYKGLVIATSQAYGEGLVNTDLSFMGKPNEQVLLKQIMDPNANLGKLGINTFWKDGEIHYKYGPSQMFMEYASNKGMEIDPMKLEEQAANVIKGTDLLKMAVLKDIKSENDINAIINKAGDGAIATIGNTQKLLNTDFKRMQATLDSDFRNILNSAETNLLDLFSRDLTIGNSKRNYKKDLLQNPAINTLTYSSLGLDKSVDENNDGVISSDELSDEDRAVILETLINPRTIAQKEAAISEFSNYCVGLAKQEFDYMRRANQQPSFDPDDLMAKKGGNMEIEEYMKMLESDNI
jgi:hypothetical protein